MLCNASLGLGASAVSLGARSDGDFSAKKA